MRAGRAARRLGLFLTPEEIAPPPELRALRQQLAASRRSGDLFSACPGFVRAVVDPRVHRLHLAQLGAIRQLNPTLAQRRRELAERALLEGPQGLADRDKRELLGDPGALHALHLAVWQLPDGEPARRWGLPGLADSA